MATQSTKPKPAAKPKEKAEEKTFQPPAKGLLPPAVLKIAREVADSLAPGEPVKGHPRVAGRTRKAVILASLKVLPKAKQEELANMADRDVHAWVGAVLKAANTLVLSYQHHMAVIEKLGWGKHVPSVVGPRFVRGVIEKLQAPPKEEPKKKAEEPKKAAPKAAKTTKAPAKGKTPPKAAPKGKAAPKPKAPKPTKG